MENNVQKPVVVLSDGHSSRFDDKLLEFVTKEDISIFLAPPDTTGVTQLLDQINQRLHAEYRTCKDNIFSQFSTVDRRGFMTILANKWDKWTTKEKIRNAARRVGISSEGLSIEWMQKEKFLLVC